MAPQERPRCVVVGYDGGDTARTALLWAVRQAGPGVSVVAVCALGHEDPPVPLASLVPRRPGEAGRATERVSREWLVDGQDIGDVAELRTERGHPAQVLARVAADEGAELIVVGHRRGRRLETARASVARDLLHQAPCPVVVVP